MQSRCNDAQKFNVLRQFLNSKNMKTFCILFAIFFLASNNVEGQIIRRLGKVAERSAQRTVERRVDREASKRTDEAIDEILGENKNESENKNSKRKSKNSEDADASTGSFELSEEGDDEVGFKRGNKILYQDDFSRDAVGDFPAKWNTNGSGEVKKLSGFDGKWFKITPNSVVNLETTKSFPPNFTVELDLIIPGGIPYRIVGIGLGEKPERLNYTLLRDKTYGVMIYSQQDRNYDKIAFGIADKQNYTWKHKDYKIPLNKIIKMAIEVNNHQRIRIFVDGKKMVDEPRAFRPELAKSLFLHAMIHGAKETNQNHFYVSNIVVAETGTDERSNVMKDLLETGTFTTNDIRFASGSDRIETTSAGILNEIGTAMKTAPQASFVITGHTDSDGSDAANQTLSEKRALSVKKYLVSNFGINESNLLTRGKGATEPVADNTIADGKAKNRRVEFKKL